MKGILVKATGAISGVEMDESIPFFKAAGKLVGGHMEHVHPRRLEEPFCMIANEEGRLLHLPMNMIGSYLYETERHGNPIVGDIVIMKDGIADGERDIIGLEEDIQQLALILADVQDELAEAV